MSRLKFPLSSDQLELLLAFEDSQSLSELAEAMTKDASVVSRNLQRIAEDHPVLTKINRRWELTALGRKINTQTRSYLAMQKELLPSTPLRHLKTGSLFNNKSALIIINAQNGLFETSQDRQQVSEVENNILKILTHWRQQQRPVVHVKHVSENPSSRFYKDSAGSAILDTLSPLPHELLFEKTQSSAFSSPGLEDLLNTDETENIILVGFTAHECIDATAKDSSAKNFATFVVDDATASFDFHSPTGKLITAERIHRLTLTTLNALYAKVVSRQYVLDN